MSRIILIARQFHLSINPSASLFFYLSICLVIFLPVRLFCYHPISPSASSSFSSLVARLLIFLSVKLSALLLSTSESFYVGIKLCRYLFIYQSACLLISPSTCPAIFLSINPSAFYQSVELAIFLSTCPSASASLYLSVRLQRLLCLPHNLAHLHVRLPSQLSF
ncbi:unnamed protein product [Acanthosepion pharaonis]|uniref:Uncharacterized protein n=1 Tax=Acanthosepion pharaonis TaxID=158019 RepID=A0A812C189_ACAPH|nr:unnamed protein product [Sepia pharaonis]